MDANNKFVESIEATLAGMTVRRVVAKLAEVLAVARRSRSWDWIANWLFSHGVKSQRGGRVSPETLSNYFSEAKRKGLIDETRVELLISELDARLRVETLEKVGADDALVILLDSRASEFGHHVVGSIKPAQRVAHESKNPNATDVSPLVAKSWMRTNAATTVTRPTFDEIKNAIDINYARPESERDVMVSVAGVEMMISQRLQKKVHVGEIRDEAELMRMMDK